MASMQEGKLETYAHSCSLIILLFELNHYLVPVFSAKFLKLEQLDQDVGVPLDTTGVSIDGTGQVGTYFYTAPEIEQGWPKIDEKADMYSLGIVFFELWHPFATAMERHVVLSDLKQKGDLPAAWVAEFSEQASLLRRLMSQSPSERPSALELLQHAFPPRMEYQLLDKQPSSAIVTIDDDSCLE
ncbi:eIF-2-alpha kinase GCN2 isoform X5 [Cucumis melo var. makuwa]|uniref:EIF-2-alpha kinase GCN2 isoform X5 n=1 Tax=Cucumis melo var. makuwa TaxID=1194695 RepID=A0A5A7SV21_CUCMM|nr:eIF-2-alpha kinase GCN2 isoform X5 [Cucumis melo var. makuwa]